VFLFSNFTLFNNNLDSHPRHEMESN
jgi:hypothetical protein